jgi:hypothetical protein
MKLFQGAAAAFYTYLIFNVFGIQQVFNSNDSLNVSQYVRYMNSGMYDKIGSTIANFIFVLVCMLIFSLSTMVKRAKV